MKAFRILPVFFALSLATAACTPEPPASSGIPMSLWNQGVADPLRPIGLASGQGTPKTAPLVPSYQQGLDHIGDWRLLEINDSGAQLVIQYSQGGGCEIGQGVLVAQTDSAVALVPIYRTGSATTACDAVLRQPVGIITLDKPLGSRKLLHLPGDGTMERPSQQPSK